MLTDEQKSWIEMAIKQAKVQKESMFELSTFAIDELLKENHILQQQNKQLIETLKEISASKTGLASTLKEYAHSALISITQGGTSNGTSNHNA